MLLGLHAQGRSRLRSPPPPPPPPAVQFDHFLLVLSWPPAFCKELYISSNRPCITPLPINFTLHGFWPSNNGNSQPRDCDKDEKKYPFDFNTVTKDVISRIDNLGFWGEQWILHGTCSVSMLDQFQYFSKALQIYI
ncbi:ribonuclease T2 family protein [Medicago truncatula]|uniref:Ribonuclease T2 family protein n=1 Tax=Medicago truncatula TaxID=3880 RepID=G7IIB1_MEDTR|nr:ribonuclease T2 family protein [Medicago truncatula]